MYITIERYPWHFADFGKTWLAFGDNQVIARWNYVRTTTSKIDRPILYRTPQITTGCNWRGRLFCGGFSSDNFWNTNWEQFWEYWRGLVGNYGGLDFNPTSNFIYWSGIGSDMRWLFESTYGIVGYINDYNLFKVSKPKIFESFEKGQIGLTPMELSGIVLAIKPLNRFIVVYGDNFITLLQHVRTGLVNTFGIVTTNHVGIKHKAAVGISQSNHVFLSNDGTLYRIDQQGNITKLGYESLFRNLNKSSIVINYNRARDSFYISTPTRCFILNSLGMTETDQIIMSGVNIQGKWHAILKNRIDYVNNSFMFTHKNSSKYLIFLGGV